MRLVDDNILDELFRTAANSERLRAHYLLHASHQEKVQRYLLHLYATAMLNPIGMSYRISGKCLSSCKGN